jgi:hypothetical protein
MKLFWLAVLLLVSLPAYGAEHQWHSGEPVPAFSPGDTLYVCGQHSAWIDTSVSGVTISGACPGSPGVIEPTTPLDVSWEPVGDGVFVSEIGYEPVAIVDAGRAIGKIDKAFMHPGALGWDWLAKPPSAKELSVWQDIEVPFWDSVNAVFGYASGVTYLRYANGDDPNQKSLRVRRYANGVRITDAANVTVKDLTIRNSYSGVQIRGMNAHHNTVKNCVFEGQRFAILVSGGAEDTTIQDNTITGTYIGADSVQDWGAWLGCTTTQCGIREQVYEWHRHRFHDTDYSEKAIGLIHAGNGTRIVGNTIRRKFGAISLSKNSQRSRVLIANNSVSDVSYFGLVFQHGWDVYAINNTFSDVGYVVRIAAMQAGGSKDRSAFFFGNAFGAPGDVGQNIFLHTFASDPPASPSMYGFFDNVFYGYDFLNVGHSSILTEGMLSNTVFEYNAIYSGTTDWEFEIGEWGAVDGNRFSNHTSPALPTKPWIGSLWGNMVSEQ